ncbi:MAG: hypothetical protein COA99_06835 [Moraxellaceae bacterium]|nr:MAG: hypothetical protein COA99_06835 [Moraxellaceae bacterium]
MGNIINTARAHFFKNLTFSKIVFISIFVSFGAWWLLSTNMDIKTEINNPKNNLISTEIDDDTLEESFDFNNMDEETANQQQLAAFEAAALATGVDEISNKILKRPNFISPLEWEILKGISATKTNSDMELVKLVNHLRFAKQEEIWEELLESSETKKRHALANQLLSTIPARVSNNNIGIITAQRLQASLLNDLISDPEQRKIRQAEEAERIGVTFSIEKS